MKDATVTLPLSVFDKLRSEAQEADKSNRQLEEHLEEVTEDMEEVGRQLEVFLSFLAPWDKFQKAVTEFNQQSEEAQIIIQNDGKVKIRIFSIE